MMALLQSEHERGLRRLFFIQYCHFIAIQFGFRRVYRYANLYHPYGRHLWVDEETMQAGQEIGFSIYY
jgi:hypothetical protein